MKTPVVELSDCIVCGVCVEMCPEVFRMNAAGFIQIVELVTYPESKVDEAIKYCPANCIYWEENSPAYFMTIFSHSQEIFPLQVRHLELGIEAIEGDLTGQTAFTRKKRLYHRES